MLMPLFFSSHRLPQGPAISHRAAFPTPEEFINRYTYGRRQLLKQYYLVWVPTPAGS